MTSRPRANLVRTSSSHREVSETVSASAQPHAKRAADRVALKTDPFYSATTRREKPKLGLVIRDIRTKRGWTLKQMSEAVDITVPTLSKIERGKLTLSYEKLHHLSDSLGISLSELFAPEPSSPVPGASITARRSVDRLDKALHVVTGNCENFFLCTDLRQKEMVPLVCRIKARSLDDHGPLSRHRGEEFVYVLEGSVTVVTEFYVDFVLNVGECMYFDSSMAHGYLIAPGYENAAILSVSTS
jgi:transcriptional regulator with XRE-family HTH domain